MNGTGWQQGLMSACGMAGLIGEPGGRGKGGRGFAPPGVRLVKSWYAFRMTRTARKTSPSFDPIGSEARLIAAFLKAADKFDAKHSRTKAAARRQLIKEGILTPTGRLSKRYGG